MLEADRQGFLLDTLDIAKLNAQRDIVKNERRQGVDNQPYGKVDEILARATTREQSYSWDVIGSMEDLSAASADDVKASSGPTTHPTTRSCRSSATSTRCRRRRLSRSTSATSRGKPVSGPPLGRPPCPPNAGSSTKIASRCRSLSPVADRGREERRLVCTRRARQHPSRPRTARLTKALVYDQQAAARLSAYQNSNEDVGEFVVVATPRPGTR